MKRLAIIIVALGLLVGCGSGLAEYGPKEYEPKAEPTPPRYSTLSADNGKKAYLHLIEVEDRNTGETWLVCRYGESLVLLRHTGGEP
jgi:hypothetical protein